MRYFILITFSLTLFFALSLNAGISIDSRVDKSAVTIGELITYTVEVRRTSDIKVEMPDLGGNLGSFELRNYTVHDPIKMDGNIIEKIDYIISTFDTGEFEIPPLTFGYQAAGDSVTMNLTTKKISIQVESMKPSEAGEIRDVKNPLELAPSYARYFVWLSIALGAILLISLAIYIYYRKRRGKGLLPEKVEPPRPAHELALEALDNLKASTLLADGHIKKYYIELSIIVRKYIEGRYFVVALELTTDELIQELKEADVERDSIQLIHRFLGVCDLVKFAKYKPNEEIHAQTFEQAYNLIEKTKLLYDIEIDQEVGANGVAQNKNTHEVNEAV